MMVFLTSGFAFQRCADGFGDRQQGNIDHVSGRSWTAIAGIHQLDGATRRGQADDGQLEQPSSLMHLRLFQAHSVAFQRPEQLFDSPS